MESDVFGFGKAIFMSKSHLVTTLPVANEAVYSQRSVPCSVQTQLLISTAGNVNV